jgi:hypothetical protein
MLFDATQGKSIAAPLVTSLGGTAPQERREQP